MVGGDLVAEAPRAAMDHETDLPLSDPIDLCRFRIDDLPHHLDLQEVVSRAERPELRQATLARFGTDGSWVCARHRALFLTPDEVRPGTEPALNRPPRAAHHDISQLLIRDPQGALCTHTRRHGSKEPLDQIPFPAGEIGLGQGCRDQPDAAVDVEPDPPGRYDPLDHVKRGVTADGKPVSPVDIGHGK